MWTNGLRTWWMRRRRRKRSQTCAVILMGRLLFSELHPRNRVSRQVECVWGGMGGKGTRRNAIPSPYRISLLRVKRFEILREGNVKRDFVSIGGICLSKMDKTPFSRVASRNENIFIRIINWTFDQQVWFFFKYFLIINVVTRL